MANATAGRACPSCGKPASGRFCVHCGASLSERHCPRCGATLGGGVRFCGQCGAALSDLLGQGRGRQDRMAWFAGGGAAVLVLGGLVFLLLRGSAAPPAAGAAPVAPFAAGSGGAGPAPDISNLSPRERFDRLFDRVMRAAENGDEATVTTFSPMAISAYQMLDTVDVDARYDAALIKLHTGDIAGATALADTILEEAPGHLFGFVLRGTVARFQRNQAVLDRSYRDFLAHYDAELKAKRPEYELHRRAIEDFRRAALDRKGNTP